MDATIVVDAKQSLKQSASHKPFYLPRAPSSKHQVPYHKPRTQTHRPPKHRLRGTPSFRRTLKLLVTTTHIALCRIHVADQLRNILLLRGEMRDEGFLEGGYFQERFFGVPRWWLVMWLVADEGK